MPNYITMNNNLYYEYVIATHVDVLPRLKTNDNQIDKHDQFNR